MRMLLKSYGYELTSVQKNIQPLVRISKRFYVYVDERFNKDSDGYNIHTLDKNDFLDACPLSNSDNHMEKYHRAHEVSTDNNFDDIKNLDNLEIETCNDDEAKSASEVSHSDSLCVMKVRLTVKTLKEVTKWDA